MMTRFGTSLISLGLLASLAAHAEAATYYAYSEFADVMSCDAKIEVPTLGLRKADGTLPTRTVHDCRPYGNNTPSSKQMPFINRQTGERFVQNAPGTLSLQCGAHGCALQNQVLGYTQGALVGEGTPGNYYVENGWYLGYDSQGKTVAYRNDVGPAQGQAPYGTSKPRPAKYGKEACFDDEIESIQAEEPNYPISFDMMNEIRAECGLPLEE